MNKKLLRLLSCILIISCALLFVTKTIPASAATCGGINTSLIECKEGGDGSIYHLLSLIIDIFSIGVGILAVVGISWAGIQYLTAGGSEERATKAKRRLSDIILGLACYVAIWAIAFWLLPGGMFNPSVDNTGVTKVSISYSGKSDTDSAFTPKVTFNEDAKDKTYSLVSSNTNIARTLGRNVKCVSAGKVNISVLTANGTQSSINVNCEKGTGSSSISSSDSQTAADGSTVASDGSATVGSQANTNLKNSKTRRRKKTKEIIEEHWKDFYSTGEKSYTKVLKAEFNNSYEKYVKSLGGVFADYIGHKGKINKVKTAADFQAAAEYVWGLLAIWGPDYSTRDYYYAWLPSDTAFYHYDSVRSARLFSGQSLTVDNLLKNSGKSANSTSQIYSINTMCNKTIAIFLNTIGKSETKAKAGRAIKSKVSNMKVGDYIGFNSGHVAIVGEVYKDAVVLYDGGSRFQTHKGNYKFYIKKTSRNDGSIKAGLTNGNYNLNGTYTIRRFMNINQNITLKGIN